MKLENERTQDRLEPGSLTPVQIPTHHLTTKLPRSMNDVHLNRLYLYITFGFITRYYSLMKSTVLYTSYSI